MQDPDQGLRDTRLDRVGRARAGAQDESDVNGSTERGRDRVEDGKARLSLAALDERQEAVIDLGERRQTSLRQTGVDAHAPELGSDPSRRSRQRRPVAVLGALRFVSSVPFGHATGKPRVRSTTGLLCAAPCRVTAPRVDRETTILTAVAYGRPVDRLALPAGNDSGRSRRQTESADAPALSDGQPGDDSSARRASASRRFRCPRDNAWTRRTAQVSRCRRVCCPRDNATPRARAWAWARARALRCRREVRSISTSGLIARFRLYCPSRGSPDPNPPPAASVRGLTTAATATPCRTTGPARRSPRALLARRPRLVPVELRGADPGPGRGLGGHLGRPPHADPRPDRQRQDPGRVPVVPGPAGARPEPATGQGSPRPGPGPVRLAAQGADLRRRAQPPGAADRDRPGGAAARRGTAAHLGRVADRRHALGGSPPDRAPRRRTS